MQKKYVKKTVRKEAQKRASPPAPDSLDEPEPREPQQVFAQQLVAPQHAQVQHAALPASPRRAVQLPACCSAPEARALAQADAPEVRQLPPSAA